jgi:hypothetical protein
LNQSHGEIFSLSQAREVLLRDVQRALVSARGDVLKTTPIIDRTPSWIVTWAQPHAVEKTPSENN